MKILMITNDTNFAWNLRREVLEAFLAHGHLVYLAAEVMDFKPEFRKLGVRVINIKNDRRGTNPFSDLMLFRKYLKIIGKLKPDVVFTNNIKPNVYAGLACQIKRIKYVANITGLGTPVENKGILQIISIFLYRKGIKKASAVFFQNTENRSFFHQHRMLRRGVREILLPGSGVNLDAHPVLPWPSNDEPIRFLFVARIMKEKGIDYFLAAARKYASERVAFDICGQCDDPVYQNLLENEPTVTYHGLQKDVLPFYEKCSCYLYPSYYPEGMSNVLLEAASCGRPVIAANRSGCKEIVDNGITGFIVPIKNEKAVLKAVETMIKMTSEQRENMGKAGRTKVEKEFDRKIVVSEYMGIIDDIDRFRIR